MASPSGSGGSCRSVVIVGSGVVGTATGLGLQAKGHRVLFCDISWTRVHLLRGQGFDAIHAVQLPDMLPDAYLLSVPTPTVDQRVDLSFVLDAAAIVGTAMAAHPGRPLVVVRSTVPPGTTERHIIPVLEHTSGRTAGVGFGVCMNPEFLRAATAQADFLEPRVIVIGALDAASELALRELYEPWRAVPVVTMSLRDAEATKYTANLFNATKISFFNEMHRVLSALGVDTNAAFAAAAQGAEGLWNARYGTRGGRPYSGVCLPKDTVAFLGFAEEVGYAELLPVLKATIEVNEQLAASADVGDEP